MGREFLEESLLLSDDRHVKRVQVAFEVPKQLNDYDFGITEQEISQFLRSALPTRLPYVPIVPEVSTETRHSTLLLGVTSQPPGQVLLPHSPKASRGCLSMTKLSECPRTCNPGTPIYTSRHCHIQTVSIPWKDAWFEKIGVIHAESKPLS